VAGDTETSRKSELLKASGADIEIGCITDSTPTDVTLEGVSIGVDGVSGKRLSTVSGIVGEVAIASHTSDIAGQVSLACYSTDTREVIVKGAFGSAGVRSSSRTSETLRVTRAACVLGVFVESVDANCAITGGVGAPSTSIIAFFAKSFRVDCRKGVTTNAYIVIDSLAGGTGHAYLTDKNIGTRT
jgi:hypothetical protein